MAGSGGRYRCGAHFGGCGHNNVNALTFEQYVVRRLKRDRGTMIVHWPQAVKADEKILRQITDLQDRIDAVASDIDLSDGVIATRVRALEDRKRELESKFSGREVVSKTPAEAARLTLDMYKRWAGVGGPGGNEKMSSPEIHAVYTVLASYIREIRLLSVKAVGTNLEDRVRITYR
jgi:hypothetical protein